MAKKGDINKTIEEAVKDPNRTILETTADRDLFAGRYRKTDDRIGGGGGMGDVFVAEDIKLHNTKVVIKMLKLDGLKNPEGWKERFKREVEIARSLSGNDNIVPVFEYGECKENARPYMTMEYIDDAIDLATYVAEKGGRLKEKEICEILKPIAEAIDFAHRPTRKRKAVVHRDIKPANILVQNTDGEVHPWILDFGISKSIDPTRDHPDVTLTDIAGTVGYMPPEKLNGERHPHPAQDIYSFAVVLYECLIGHHPFEDSDGRLPTQAVLRDKIQAADFEHPGEPASYLAKMIVRGLSPKPEDRPKTCVEFFERKEAVGSDTVDHDFALAQTQFEWTGQPIIPTVLKDGKEIKGGQEYLIRCKNNVEVGEAAVEIAGFAVSRTELKFKIVPRSISRKNAFKVSEIQPQQFCGKAILPSVKVTDLELGSELRIDRDYVVEEIGRGNVGEGWVRIIGKGNYTGELDKSFEILPKSLAASTICIEKIEDVEFNGTPQRPQIVLRDKDLGCQLVPDVDYEVKYGNEILGSSRVEITGKGNYEGVKSRRFEIKARDIAKVEIKPIIDQVYEGLPLKKIDVTVFDPAIGHELKCGTDYVVECQNSDLPGDALACVRGQGNYRGQKNREFRIRKGRFSDIANTGCRCEFDAAWHGIDVNVKNAPPGLKVLYSFTEDGEYQENECKLRDVCAPTLIYFRLECPGYVSYSGVGTVEILPRSIKALRIPPIEPQVYNGSHLCPAIGVFDSRLSVQLVEGKDYRVEEIERPVVGKGQVRIVGTGNYKDSKDVDFEIAPRSLAHARMDPILDQLFDGMVKQPPVVIRDNDLKCELKQGQDFELEYDDNSQVGECSVRAIGIGHYSGSIQSSYKIAPRSIEGLEIRVKTGVEYGEHTGDVIDFIFDPVLGVQLRKNVDYVVREVRQLGIGKAIVVIEGRGNYCGDEKKDFDLSPRPLREDFIRPIPDVVFDESRVKPDVRVVDDQLDALLEEGVEYALEYQNVDAPGRGKVVLRGLGNYKGQCVAHFVIKDRPKKKFDVVGKVVEFDGIYDGNPHGLTIDSREFPSGTTIVYCDSRCAYQTEGSRDSVSFVNAGEYSVTFALSHPEYETFVSRGLVSIAPCKIESDWISCFPPSGNDGGRPIVTVMARPWGIPLQEGRDFLCRFSANSPEKGWGTVLVEGKGNFCGEYKSIFLMPDVRLQKLLSVFDGLPVSVERLHYDDWLICLKGDVVNRGLVLVDSLGVLQLDLNGFRISSGKDHAIRMIADEELGAVDDFPEVGMPQNLWADKVTKLLIVDSRPSADSGVFCDGEDAIAVDDDVHPRAKIDVDDGVVMKGVRHAGR